MLTSVQVLVDGAEDELRLVVSVQDACGDSLMVVDVGTEVESFPFDIVTPPVGMVAALSEPGGAVASVDSSN